RCGKAANTLVGRTQNFQYEELSLVLWGPSEGALCAGLTNRPLRTIIRQTPAFCTRFRQIFRLRDAARVPAPCVPGKASNPRFALESHRQRACPRRRGLLYVLFPARSSSVGMCLKCGAVLIMAG